MHSIRFKNLDYLKGFSIVSQEPPLRQGTIRLRFFLTGVQVTKGLRKPDPKLLCHSLVGPRLVDYIWAIVKESPVVSHRLDILRVFLRQGDRFLKHAMLLQMGPSQTPTLGVGFTLTSSPHVSIPTDLTQNVVPEVRIDLPIAFRELPPEGGTERV